MEQIYHQALLSLAAGVRALPALPDYDLEAMKNNPVCGDQVRIMARTDHRHITACTLEVRGCALCEAGAGLWHQLACSTSLEQLPFLADEMKSYLTESNSPLSGSPLSGSQLFGTGIDAFAPIKAIKNRHKCVLLAFEAGRSLADAAPKG